MEIRAPAGMFRNRMMSCPLNLTGTRAIMAKRSRRTAGNIWNMRTQRRLLASDTNIPLQIERLNHRFKSHFRPIGDHPFPIQEAHTVLQTILAGKNVLLLGDAGIGKSGCVQALLDELDNEHIPYLAFSADQKVPQGTPEYYGEALGFRASPVLCLESQLASGQMGVLILDQLDSLRWATRSCEEALDVCGEMPRQVQALSCGGDRTVRVIWSAASLTTKTIWRCAGFAHRQPLNSLVSGSQSNCTHGTKNGWKLL